MTGIDISSFVLGIMTFPVVFFYYHLLYSHWRYKKTKKWARFDLFVRSFHGDKA